MPSRIVVLELGIHMSAQTSPSLRLHITTKKLFNLYGLDARTKAIQLVRLHSVRAVLLTTLYAAALDELVSSASRLDLLIQ